MDLQDDVTYIIRTTVDVTNGSLQQVTPGSTVMNFFMSQSAILAKTDAINWNQCCCHEILFSSKSKS